jgi:ankyrin repeat protein
MNSTHALHEAVQAGDLEHVTVLLKNNPVLVFSEDWNGDTPLHLAAYFGYRDIAELL